MSEDCLHVNVFVPSAQLPVIENVTKPLAVFVWIHGGAFQQGSGNIDGKSLATFGNIIVVSINYRLGALGFLTTLDQEATGNYGLWDQRLALQWVKTNIRAFGGDPDEITIGGGSAGGFSVSFQSLHAENEGLFRRFIAESGNAISVMNNRDNAAEYTKVLARQLACDTTSSQTIVSCLRQKNFTDIATKLLLPLGPFELPWGPAIDGDFFQQNPSDEITWPPSKADLSVVKSMDGIFVTAGAEGSVSYDMWVRIIAKQLNQTVTHGVSKQVFDKVIDGMLSSQKQSSDPQIISAIVYEYTDWEDPDNPATLGQSTVDLLTDQQWFVPNVVFSRNHALNNNHTSTYLLQFDQKPLSRGWLHGAPHVAYGRYVWGAQGNDKEWELSKVFMTYWSNFIKTGNPNSPSPTHTQWLPFDVHDEHYLLIDNDVSGISDGKHCKARRTDFWLDYLPGVKVAAARNHGDVNPATRKPDCSASAGERPLDGSQSTIAAFRGIPYAEPPVGQLRFAKPVPKANLTTPFQALQFGPSCPQRRNVDMSEDCLYLNVYLPSAALPVSQNASAGHVPVYVWIHGGAFVSGDGRRDVERLVVFGDIIIVTINYRLGALGFLATGDQEAPGNYGLWDQRLALQWVKANIRAFVRSTDSIFATEAADGSVSFGIWVEDMAQELNQSVQQGVSKQLFHTVVNKLLMSENQTPDPLVKDAIAYEYTDWEDPDNPATLGQSTVDLLTDQQWFVPNVVFSRNHVLNNNHTSTYLLQFDLPKELTGQRYPWLRGAQHGQYNPFVWGLAGQTLNMSTAGDRKQWELSKAIMTYWSNFIKTGRTDFWLDFLPKVKAASGRYQDNVNSDCSSSATIMKHSGVVKRR
nr:hypothetical protein BaRGS_009291 [Batillaria attramentaria]